MRWGMRVRKGGNGVPKMEAEAGLPRGPHDSSGHNIGHKSPFGKGKRTVSPCGSEPGAGDAEAPSPALPNGDA